MFSFVIIQRKHFFRVHDWVNHTISLFDEKPAQMVQYSRSSDCFSDLFSNSQYRVSTIGEKLADRSISRRKFGESFKAVDLCECENRCSRNDRCKAFTYKPRGFRVNCFLKGSLSQKIKRPRKSNDLIFAEKIWFVWWLRLQQTVYKNMRDKHPLWTNCTWHSIIKTSLRKYTRIKSSVLSMIVYI